MASSIRHFAFIVILLCLILVLGTVGYYFGEDGWTLRDAFYMSVITITTVGFGEVRELSAYGRAFTVGLIFIGFITVGLWSASMARFIIDTELKRSFGRGRMKKKIAQLKNHYVVCGFGRIGGAVANELAEIGVPFVIVEQDEDLVAEAEGKGYLALRENATSDEALKAAGIEHAAGVVAALLNDADNLFISLAVRELNPDALIVARSEQPGVEDRMMRAGANIVVSPLKLGGAQIARIIAQHRQPSSEEKMGEAVTGAMGFALHVFRPGQEGAKTVREALEEGGAAMAIALRRADGTTLLTPDLEEEMEPDDALVLCIDSR